MCCIKETVERVCMCVCIYVHVYVHCVCKREERKYQEM